MDIKGLRELVGLTQVGLSEATGIPRGRIAMWERGKANPKVDDYNQLAKLFMSSIEKLQQDSSRVFNEQELVLIEEFVKEYKLKHSTVSIVEGAIYALKLGLNPNTSASDTDGEYKRILSDNENLLTMSVPLVPFEAHARYLSEVDTRYEEWETATFTVDHIGKGHYLAFKHKGESMINLDFPSINDTPDGAVSLCRELGKQHWKDGFNAKNAPYGWIILTQKNILHKDIIDFDPVNGNITCHSRNPSPEYSDFVLNLDEVFQIFKVIKRTF